jgi:ornithine cyclodeaminase
MTKLHIRWTPDASDEDVIADEEDLHTMKIIEREEVFQKLDMKTCISLMREALIALEEGKAFQPVRSICKFPQGEAFGFMPAYMGVDDCFGAKVLSAFPQNAGTEYPSHIGYVMIFESQHGTCKGLADAGAITQIRTGAVSGVATDLLANKDARSLGIIGAGAQGRSHLEAMLAVRPGIETINVYDVNKNAAQRYKQEMEEKFQKSITVCDSVQEAVADCDIVCTLTPSKEAYLTRDMIKAGAHVNAVGTFSPVTREAASDLVAAAGLYADQVEAMKKESGEYLVPLSEGLISEDHIRGSIGALLLGKAPGRASAEEITLFDALGLAVEDVICGRYLLS